jgi:hypothetical protein
MRTSLRLLAAGILLTGAADRGEAAERHPCRFTIRCQNPRKTRVFRVERYRVETCRAARAQARERRRPEYGGQALLHRQRAELRLLDLDDQQQLQESDHHRRALRPQRCRRQLAWSGAMDRTSRTPGSGVGGRNRRTTARFRITVTEPPTLGAVRTQHTCSMNGGASGGPWLKDRIDANLGYVFAVTSRRTTSGTPTLLSTPNTADVKTMFDQMTT